MNTRRPSAPVLVLPVDDEQCRQFVDAAALVGKKWSVAILLAGARGARRFTEYRAGVPGVSDRLLSARLQELVSEGLLERAVRPTTPVSITYRPTREGMRLSSALTPLVEWGSRRARPQSRGGEEIRP